MKRTFRIFISGTYNDLQQERAAVERVLTELEYMPVRMKFPASPDSGRDVKRKESLRILESCDAMILIFGDRYGTPDLPDDRRSITEVEFDWAITNQYPCYVFMKESWESKETDPEVKEQHQKFREKIDNQKLRANFASIDSLKYEVQKALITNPVIQEIEGRPFYACQEFFYEGLAENAPPHLSLKHPLLCRYSELENLLNFTSGNNSRIFSIIGGQGLGKSRLLLEWASNSNEGHNILFVNQLAFLGCEFDKAAIDFVPHSGSVIIVFDDAHDVQNLTNAVLQLLIARNNVKIVVAGRPSFDYGKSLEVLEQDYKTRYSPQRIELKPLPPDSQEFNKFLSEMLPQHAGLPMFTLRFQQAIGGIPWLLHFTVLFLKEGGELPPVLVSRDSKFRQFVIQKILHTNQNAASAKIMYWLALISPIEDINNKSWKEAFAKLLSVSNDDITMCIDQWCRERLLRIKGRRLLFTSQIVQDFFIFELANSGDLHKKVFDYFWSPLIENILQNLSLGAALDAFDQSGQPSTISRVLEEIWEKLREETLNESPFGQSQIMEWLEPVAWYQPTHVRDLVANIVANPSKVPNPENLGQLYTWSHKDVIKKFVPLLRAIAHHDEYFDWACNLLWDLALKDERQTNPYPDHPMRVLGELASYRQGKQLWFTRRSIELAKSWIAGTSDKVLKHSPVKIILGEALSREAEFSESKGFSFSFGAIPISTTLIADIQDKALDILFEIIKDQGDRYYAPLVKDAIEELTDFATGPHKPSMAQFTEEQEEQWKQRAQATLARIKEFIGCTKLQPLVRYLFWKNLDWLSRHGVESLQKQAKEIQETISTTAEGNLEFQLYQSSIRNIFENEEIWNHRRLEVANELLRVYANDNALLDFLAGIEINLKRFQITGHDPFPILMELAAINPKRAINTTLLIIKERRDTLHNFIPDLIGPLFPNIEFTEQVRSFIQEYLLQPHYLLYASEAYRRFPPPVLSEVDYRILETLVSWDFKDEAPALINSLLHAIWHLLRRNIGDPKKLKDILLKIPIQGNAHASDEFFMIISGDKIYSLLTTEDKGLILSRIEHLQKLDDAYFAELFLEHIARENPALIVQLFKTRFDLEKNKKIKRALPYHGLEKVFSSIRSHINYVDILKQIRDMSLGLSPVQMLEMKSVFGSLGGSFGKEVQDVLLEWLDGGDLQKFDLALSLLEEGPNSFVFNNVELIDRIFCLLEQLPGDQYKRRQHLKASLFNMAEHGATSRTLGTPSIKHQEMLENTKQIIKEGAGRLSSETIRFYQSLSHYAAKTQEEDRLRDEEDFVE